MPAAGRGGASGVFGVHTGGGGGGGGAILIASGTSSTAATITLTGTLKAIGGQGGTGS